MPSETATELVDDLRRAASLVREAHELYRDAQESVIDAYRDLQHVLLLVSRSLSRDDRGRAFDHLVDDTDRAILRALADGVPRTRLPTHLHLTKRTVDTRIQRLKDLTGSAVMFQLARSAALLGWLTVERTDRR